MFCLCVCLGAGFVDWARKGLYIWEEFWSVNLLMAEFDWPKVLIEVTSVVGRTLESSYSLTPALWHSTSLVHKCSHCFCGLDWVFISSPPFISSSKTGSLFQWGSSSTTSRKGELASWWPWRRSWWWRSRGGRWKSSLEAIAALEVR